MTFGSVGFSPVTIWSSTEKTQHYCTVLYCLYCSVWFYTVLYYTVVVGLRPVTIWRSTVL